MPHDEPRRLDEAADVCLRMMVEHAAVMKGEKS